MATVAEEQVGSRPATRSIAWVVRLAVLAGLAYLFLYRMPMDPVFAPIYADAAIYAIVGLSLNILIGSRQYCLRIR